MKHKTLTWLLIATFLLLMGCILFGGVMMALKWDFSRLYTVKYETNEYTVSDPVQGVLVVTDTADIALIPSETVSVDCTEQENAKHSVSVKDGILQIEIVDQRKWYERIGFNFGTTKIRVYIPKGEYEVLTIKGSTGGVVIPEDYAFAKMDIHQSTGYVTCQASTTDTMKIKTSTGNIHVENVSTGHLELSVTTGKIITTNVSCCGDMHVSVSTGKTILTNVSCKNLSTNGNTGDIVLKNVVAEEKLTIKRSTGHVKFESCDAAEINVKTDTGDVTGTLLSEKLFLCKTDTGRVDVPKATAGGVCEVTTDTGDIRLKISNG